MTERLRIAVADDEPTTLANLRESLAELGHEVVCAAQTGAELVEQSLALRPDLIVTDIKMPDMDGLEASRRVALQAQIPVIIVSAFHDEDYLRRSLEDHVMAYLIKPVKQAELAAAVVLAIGRFREFEALRRQAANLEQALKDRKTIERAKGILMKRGRLDEPDAFARLQKLARDKNLKLADVAQSILTAEEAFGGEN